MKTYALLAAAMLTSTLSAQNWTVGTPVNMLMSEMTIASYNCYPDPQAQLNLNHTPVSGVQYYYEVSNVLNGGFFTMVPGPSGGLNIGDTVHVPANGVTQVFNQQTQGSLVLRLMAAGTPTTAGEAHPCSRNDLWISNLMLCNEMRNKTLQTNCTVQAGSTAGIAEVAGAPAWFASNGTSIRLIDPSVRTAQLVDAQGRVVATTSNSDGMLELGTLPTGMYVVRAQRADGSALTERVMLAQ